MDQNVLTGKDYFIFDLDNTLINTNKSHLQGVFNVCKQFPNKKKLYSEMISFFDSINEQSDSLSRNDRYKCYENFRLNKEPMYYEWVEIGEAFEKRNGENWDLKSLDKIYWDGVGQYVEFNDSADDVLLALSNLGKGISILTNGGLVQHKKISKVKETLQPLVDFDMAVVTGDYGSRHYKPDGYCMNKILNFYNNQRARCVYIGDRIKEDYGVSKNCAVDFILYDPEEKYCDFDGKRIFNLMELLQ